jgi:uncharacterized protein YdhG (YjbR/CyaY superfamily)
VARSQATTPDAYLDEQEPSRRAELAAVRDAVNAAMPDGYAERIAWGMISWEVPLELSGPTYNGQPLLYAALAAQKSHNALYLNCMAYSPERSERLRQRFAESGLKLDMGKSCVRFRRADQLDLDAIKDEIASTTPAEFADAAAKPHSSR